MRSGFLVAQVALSAVLLTGGALTLRSVAHAATSDPGYRIDGIAVVRVNSPAVFDAVRLSFRDAGLRPPAEASLVPLMRSRRSTGVRRPDESEDALRSAYTIDVSPEYFDVLQIPVVQGRTFVEGGDPNDVVVNESLARLLWRDEPAFGRSIVQEVERRVVGVVADAYLSGLARVEPTLFRQGVQGSSPFRVLLAPDDPATIERIRAAALAVSPGVRVSVTPLRDNLREALALPLLGASIAGSIGLLAIVLAAVGIAGVFAFVVHERTSEIGIRMALGARSVQVIGLVNRQAGWPLLGGLGLGLVASLLAAPVLRAYLLDVSPYDVTAFGAVAVVVCLVGLAATWLPTRRATRVDPVRALRVD
jgi:macrolide transport system ATP-binding/permease protein